MQSRAFIRRSPQVCRIVKAPTPTTSRNMSLFSPTPFIVRGAPFPSYPIASFEREVAPLFHMMEDLNRTFEHHFLATAPRARAAPVPFQPRFDVTEVSGAYELRGELPGVESSDIDIEFTDAQTLVIRGRTESETRRGTPSAQSQQQQAPETVDAPGLMTNAVGDDGASTNSTSSYQKATVEDDAAESAASTPGQATTAESITSEAPQQTQINTQATAAEPTSTTADTTAAHDPQYWISERRTGSFQRVFKFSGKIDQEAVTATLKNGVLSVVVPKAVQQTTRRISVQ